jgi:cell division protein YceG involved in septum cleavage
MNTQNGKIIIWLVVLALIIAAGFIWYRYYFAQSEPLSGEDTTSAIENDLGAVDLGDLDSDFQSVDKDLNSF